MQRILRLLVAGAEQANWNDQGKFIADQWTPSPPKLLETGEYDLVSPVTEDVQGWVVGRDRDTLIENRNVLERLLIKAARVQANIRHAGACELEMADSGATYAVKAPLLGGGLTLQTDLARRKDGKLAQKATLKLVRGPVWEGPETTITPTLSLSNNGTGNLIDLPALLGDLPARCRLRITASGGNSANIQALLVGYRYIGSPSTAFYSRFGAALPAGWTITLGTDTVSAADANFVTGQRLRYTPNAGRTGEQLFARWETAASTSIADLLSGPGGFLPVVRYRDNAASTNFSLRMRAGVKIGSSYQYGAWSNPEPVADLFASSAATVELGSLLLGAVHVGMGDDDQTPQTLVYELWITATAVTGSFDLDYFQTLPLGESGDGRGLVYAEFPAGLGSNRAYLDSRLRKDLAYLSDANDVKLCTASDTPDGGEIWLWPQVAGKRLLVWAMRNRDNLCKHQGNTTLAATLTYVPRYIRDRGNLT